MRSFLALLPSLAALTSLLMGWMVVTCQSSTVSDNPSTKSNKQLVLLAGPHEAGASEGIRKFFDLHATDYHDSQPSDSLSGWEWPTLDQKALTAIVEQENVSRHSIFKLLFQKKQNETTQETLMSAIRDSWEKADSGIILGDEKFDKIGVNPYSSLDGLRQVYRIVEYLQVPREDVTIVLLYSAPRIDQWGAIYNKKSRYDTYRDFLCKEHDADLLWEYIDTAMNAMKLSKDFLQNGFNVVVIDEEGTRQSDQDPAHAIACNILAADCDDSYWINGLKEERTEISQTHGLTVSDLPEAEQKDLELLFNQRDCVYQSELKKWPQFEVLNQRALWSSCDPRSESDTEYRETLMDIDFMVDVIKSQKCNSTSSHASDLSPPTLGTMKQDQTELDSTISTNKAMETLLIALLVILSLCLVVLAYLLFKKRQSRKLYGQSDGLFKSQNTCIFRKRDLPEGSTEESSDEETPNSSTVTDMIDVPLESNLCTACRLVRVDPNCIFCGGGRPSLPVRRVVKKGAVSRSDEEKSDGDWVCMACNASLKGPNSSCTRCVGRSVGIITSVAADFDDLNERWLSNDTKPQDKDVSDGIFNQDQVGYRDEEAKKSETPNTTKRESKSLAFMKLKELRDLKNQKDICETAEIVFRDDESVIEFS